MIAAQKYFVLQGAKLILFDYLLMIVEPAMQPIMIITIISL